MSFFDQFAPNFDVWAPSLDVTYSDPSGSVWGTPSQQLDFFGADYINGFGGNQIAPNQIDTYMQYPSFSVGSGGGYGFEAGNAPTTFMPDTPAGVTLSEGGGSPWYQGVLDEFGKMPLDKQVGLGMGVLSGLGGMMAARQSNRFAKDAAKRNRRLREMEEAQWKRMQRNQAINDKYNYSIDTTAPATVNYRPLTAEQAMSYGETGAPFQQLEVVPGATTRTQLFSEGGEVERNIDEPSLLGFAEYLYEGKRLPSEVAEAKKASALERLREVGGKGGFGKMVTDRQKMLQEAGMAQGGLACMKCGGGMDYAAGGYALGGATGGQDDVVPAMLSDGEYVFDADTVAALGDGNTKKGASVLDQMRMEIRKHKRSAPVDKIPPKAKKPEQYMKKGKK